MTALAPVAVFAARTTTGGVERAVGEARRLLLAAETHAVMLAELGAIDLPPTASAQPMQMRAIASLYLASTLEAAGLIDATDDLARLARSGAIQGDLGDAAPLVAAFWNERGQRANSGERAALFSGLFGRPGGATDIGGSANGDFEERLLDLCDAIIAAADRGAPGRVRTAGERLAENVAGTASETVLLMARDIIASLSQAIAILNHPQVRTVLMARTLWESVSAIDRRFRRPPRPTLSYLRRGRAGMTVLAWLADVLEGHDDGGALRGTNEAVLEAAINWVDETLAIIRAEEDGSATGRPDTSEGRPQSPSGGPAWLDLAR